MKLKLENREYEAHANGAFMKKYQETFHENMIVALYKAIQEKDILTVSKLMYCAIDEEMSFDDWIASFETPMFALAAMDQFIEYLIRSTTPTVSPNETGEKKDDSKKKN